jgi:hypothetical protein
LGNIFVRVTTKLNHANTEDVDVSHRLLLNDCLLD